MKTAFLALIVCLSMLAGTSAVSAAEGGSVSRYRLDRDDGRLVHEVTILKDDKRYRLEIDDATGNVDELSIKQ